ncbi:MAG: iron ABC transporter permease [Muribaculaceae bacterium]|nr:iron ABC transporter permease [Muribaculaceae bacterium]
MKTIRLSATRWGVLFIALIVSFLGNLYIGSVNIPFDAVTDILTARAGDSVSSGVRFIILQSRLPGALTAVLSGAALAVSGLLLQTSFRNPLAGPSVLGINSGASLGVAVVMLIGGGSMIAGAMEFGAEIAIMIGALIGSFLIMAVLLALSAWLRNDLMLLIAGILVGYLASSVIMILNFSATSDGVQNYVIWGMGSFTAVPLDRMPVFATMVVIGLLFAIILAKPLDLLLLGNDYARNLGVNLSRTRNMLLLATGLLAAAVTAFCGPVSFIGLAVPHMARMIMKTDTHRILLPATIIIGAIVGAACNILSVLPSSGLIPGINSAALLPLNAVTPLFGVPVILYVILHRR